MRVGSHLAIVNRVVAGVKRWECPTCGCWWASFTGITKTCSPRKAKR